MKNYFILIIVLVFNCILSHAQCDMDVNEFTLATYTSVTSDTQAEPSDDFVICDGVNYSFADNGIHDVWMENGAELQYNGNGIATIIATNNSYVDYQGNGIGTVYVAAGSTVLITDGSHTVYVECGGSVLVDTYGSSLDIFYECEEDITYIAGNTAGTTLTQCDVSLNFPTAPSVIVDIGGYQEVGCDDYPLTLDASAVPGPYLWSTGETSATIEVNAPGEFTVEVPSICSNASGTAIIATTIPEIDLGEPLDYCGLPLPITLDAGPGFDSYLWSTGEITQTIEVSDYDNYSVTGSVSCGSSSDDIDVIGIGDPPPVDFNGTFTTCDDIFPAILDAGPGFDSYLWSTGETTQTIEVNTLGVFTVDIVNLCNTGTYTYDLNAQITPPDITFPDDISLCNASFPITLDATGPFDDYLWSTGETTPSILVTGPGVYEVEISNSCGTGGDEIEFFSLGDAPQIDLGNDLEFCGSDFPITLDAGPGFDSYLWSTGETTQTISVSNSSNVSVTVSNSCGTSTDDITITNLGSGPNINLGSDQNVFEEFFPITLNAGNEADSYLWNTGETTQTIEVDGPGTFSVEATNACGSGTDEVVVTINDPCEYNLSNYGLSVFNDGGTSATLSGVNTISVGGFTDYIACTDSETLFDGSGFHNFWLEENASMEIDGASGFFSVYALNNNTIEITDGSGGGNFYLRAGSSATIYNTSSSYTYYLECGATLIIDTPQNFGGQIIAECPDQDIIDVQGSINIISNPDYLIECTEVTFDLTPAQIPGVILDLGGAIEIDCTAFPYTLDASSVPGPYAWSTGETTSTIQVNAPGTFTCSVPSACGTAAGTAIISIPASPVIDLGIDLTLCNADFPVTLDAGLGFDSYLWSTGETTQTISIATPGSISLQATNSCGTGTDDLEITSLGDIPMLDLGPDIQVCDIDFPVTLDAGAGFDSYLWSTGVTTQTFTLSTATTMEVTVTNACGSNSDEIIVNSSGSTPIVDLGMDLALCNADFPVTIDVGAGFDSYLWSTGETTQSITLNDQATVSVEATNSCGIGIDEVTVISLGDTPDVDLGPDIQVCDSEFPVVLDAGAGFDSYLWNNGGTTQTFALPTPQTMEVTVTNACGSNSDEIVVTSSGSTPIVDLGADLVLCNADFPSTINAGIGFDSYLWSTGETTQTIEINTPSIISVEATNSCGTGTDEIEITSLGDGPSVDLGTDIQVCDAEFPVVLDAGAGFDSYLWSNGGTAQTFALSTPQTVEVTVTNACGSDSDEITVTSGSIENQVFDLEICDGTSAEILGQTFSEEGTFTSFISNEGADECGIDLTVNVTVLPAETEEITIAISDGGEFTYEGISYTEAGVYEINTQNDEGCFITTFLTIELLDEDAFVYIPNSFTPDKDGYNEAFGPIVYTGQDVTVNAYHFQIYNRWGLLVYESFDYENTLWNGSLLGTGEYYQPDGIYSYVLTYRFSNSTETEQVFGTINTLR